MSRYTLTPDARQDLADIREDLLREARVKVTRRVMVELVVAFRRIAGTPGIGRVRRDLLDDESALFWPADDYLIAYRRKRGTVRIVAIMHSARDLHWVLSQRKC